jgi:thiamine kinase-like enzyme
MDAADLSRRFALGGAARLSDGPVARGRQGAVWRLETDAGRWAVKVPFQPVGEDDVRLSTVFQEAAHAAGVPTPQVRRTTEGKVLADVDGRSVRVYEWVDLLPPDVGFDPARIGSIVARLHQVPAPDPGLPHPWNTAPVGAERWDELIGQLRAAGAPFTDRLADVRDELVALEGWLEPPQRLRTGHTDLWADNLLPTVDGGLCVIDWENAGAIDPSQELAQVLYEFAHADPGRARTLAEAYRAAGGPGEVRRPGHFSMLIAQLGHVTEIAATDWLQPNQRSPDRAAAEAWISEGFDDPLTRVVLEQILRAVA